MAAKREKTQSSLGMNSQGRRSLMKANGSHHCTQSSSDWHKDTGHTGALGRAEEQR